MDVLPMMPVPMPVASDAQFSPSKMITGAVVMSSSFAAALNQFATKNPNVLQNFCNNFLAVGDEAGYEYYYVVMGETDEVTQANKTAYQNAKQSIIASKCSQNSMIGLVWRKLYSLCELGQTSETITACSGFDDGSETMDSEDKGS